jgi:LPXTG-site transpeptidase (sortase) family protein
MTRSEPTELSIPDVAIQTSLLTVGRNADNTIKVPDSYETAGWYKHSPTPGEIGPTIIVGHVDSYRGPAVFWRLSQMQPMQLVKIKRADGQTVTYQVTDVKQFDQNNFPTNEVYGNITHAGLRLITCGGVYNRSTNSYSHNTVVYATMVFEPSPVVTEPEIGTTLSNLLKPAASKYVMPTTPAPFVHN